MIWRQQHRITLSAYSQVQQSLFATSRTRKWEAGGNEVRTQSGRSIRARRRRWWRHLHYKFPLIFHFSFAESLAGHDSAPQILLRSIGLTFPGSSATEMTGNRRPTPPLLPTTGQQVHRPHPPTLIARSPHKDHWTCSANACRDRSLRLSVCLSVSSGLYSVPHDLQEGGSTDWWNRRGSLDWFLWWSGYGQFTRWLIDSSDSELTDSRSAFGLFDFASHLGRIIVVTKTRQTLTSVGSL